MKLNVVYYVRGGVYIGTYVYTHILVEKALYSSVYNLIETRSLLCLLLQRLLFSSSSIIESHLMIPWQRESYHHQAKSGVGERVVSSWSSSWLCDEENNNSLGDYETYPTRMIFSSSWLLNRSQEHFPNCAHSVRFVVAYPLYAFLSNFKSCSSTPQSQCTRRSHSIVVVL